MCLFYFIPAHRTKSIVLHECLNVLYLIFLEISLCNIKFVALFFSIRVVMLVAILFLVAAIVLFLYSLRRIICPLRAFSN
jgi:hypothetical protein